MVDSRFYRGRRSIIDRWLREKAGLEERQRLREYDKLYAVLAGVERLLRWMWKVRKRKVVWAESQQGDVGKCGYLFFTSLAQLLSGLLFAWNSIAPQLLGSEMQVGQGIAGLPRLWNAALAGVVDDATGVPKSERCAR